MARKGFSSPQKQKEANEKYSKTEKGKNAGDKATAKYKANQYIDKFASAEDLEKLKIKIDKKLKELGGFKMEKLVGYVITEGNISPCGTKLSYGAKDQAQLWEAWEIKDKYGESTLEFYCIETNVDESEYGENYKDKPLLRNWECNVYNELL